MKQNQKFAIFAFNGDTPNGGCGDLYDIVGTLQTAVEVAKKAICNNNTDDNIKNNNNTSQILCMSTGKIVAHINIYSEDKAINQQILDYLTLQIR
jgi:hypothetical protein